MKRFLALFVTIAGIGSGFPFPGYATATTPGAGEEAFYEQRIEKRINACMRHAERITSGSAEVRLHAEERKLQAVFFRNYKWRLVETMKKRHVSKTTYQVDYFLITIFHAASEYALFTRMCAELE